MKSLLSKSKNAPTHRQSVAGKSFNIQFIPDPFTRELMNIGVGVVEEDGTLHTKMLSSFHRLNCLYDDRITESDMKYLIAIVEACLPRKLEGEVIPSPSMNISFSQFSYVSGENYQSILDMLFDDSMTLAVPFKDNKRNRLAGLDTTSVRSKVFESLKDILELKADRIIAQNPNFRVTIDGKNHFVDIPLQGERKLGTIISACQSLQTVRNSINDCTNQLRTAHSVHREDEMRCFTMRDEDETPSRSRELDAYFNSIEWMMNAQGIPFITSYSPEETASHISEWVR